MKPKDRAIKGAAPPDRRAPLPLSSEELAEAKQARNDHERAKIHRALLVESMRRLRAGRTLEREHGVIHPEMTCIVRDVLRLTDLVFPGAEPPAEVASAQAARELGPGAKALAALVARHGHAKIARRLGVDPKLVKAWGEGRALPDADEQATVEARFRIPRDAWGSS